MEDPALVLRHAHAALENGGAVIVTVPASTRLFSRWDEQLGHYRRYTVREFRQHANAADFRVSWLNYWNSFTIRRPVAVRGWEKLFSETHAA
ncbi:MAG: hypothetical protein U0936_20405 [Planctomycetaceae bacterium]